MSQSRTDSAPVPATERDQRGRLLKGNRTSRRHGLYAAVVDDVLQREAARFLDGSLADDGDQDIPTRRRSLHGYRARTHQHLLQVSQAIERYGLFDRRGRLRGIWLAKFESLVATAIRLDTLLGLDRKARDARALLQQYVDERQKQAQQAVQAPAGDEREPGR